MLPHMPRVRLSSIGDSAPPSEASSNTSDSNELANPDWSNPSAAGQNSNMMNTLYNSCDTDTDVLSVGTTSQTNLSDYERSQVESFFGGLGTAIYVSSSLANLYESTGKEGDWRLMFTGVPVVLHDKGCARSRAKPRVTFVLAERGSSFALWSDRIDNSSNYRSAGPSFHVMTSTNNQQLIGFSFDSSDSARELSAHIAKLVNDPDNIALSVTGRKKPKHQKPAPLPPKSQISHPCQFQHVTSVTKDDTERYYSMQVFAPAKHR